MQARRPGPVPSRRLRFPGLFGPYDDTGPIRSNRCLIVGTLRPSRVAASSCRRCRYRAAALRFVSSPLRGGTSRRPPIRVEHGRSAIASIRPEGNRQVSVRRLSNRHTAPLGDAHPTSQPVARNTEFRVRAAGVQPPARHDVPAQREEWSPGSFPVNESVRLRGRPWRLPPLRPSVGTTLAQPVFVAITRDVEERVTRLFGSRRTAASIRRHSNGRLCR